MEKLEIIMSKQAYSQIQEFLDSDVSMFNGCDISELVASFLCGLLSENTLLLEWAEHTPILDRGAASFIQMYRHEAAANEMMESLESNNIQRIQWAHNTLENLYKIYRKDCLDHFLQPISIYAFLQSVDHWKDSQNKKS